jgi:hypothetical protein
MRKIIIIGAALAALLTIPAAASAQPTVHRHACSVQHHYLGPSSNFHWWRGTTHNPADESLKTTTYAYGSGSCHRIAFQRWDSIINLVAGHPNHGSVSGHGLVGTWRRIRTVQVPHTCGDGGTTFSTPYGWFSLRVADRDGTLIGTGTVKLRLAC